jgi:hypothetical protein
MSGGKKRVIRAMACRRLAWRSMRKVATLLEVEAVGLRSGFD